MKIGNKAWSYTQLYYLNQLFVILFQIHKGQDVSQFFYTTNNFSHSSNAYIATKFNVQLEIRIHSDVRVTTSFI